MPKALSVSGILLCSLLFGITLFQKTGRPDLRIILQAADKLQTGQPFYALTDSQEHTKPPLATLVFVPLTWLPLAIAERLWDCVVIGCFFGLSLWLIRHMQLCASLARWQWVLLGLLFTLNCWNSELRCGQTNAVIFVLILMAVENKHVAVRGVSLFLAVLIKPTNILFLPWVYRHTRAFGAMGLVGALCGLFLAGLYGWGFGWPKLLADHQAWVAAMPHSVEKHVARVDSYGLPSLFSTLTTAAWLSKAFQLLGLFLCTVLAFRIRSAYQSLVWICLAAALFSPMAWVQNYVLMLPFVFFLIDRWLREPEARWVWGGSLACLYLGFQIWNPTLAATPLGSWLMPWRPPLIGLFLSIGLALWGCQKKVSTHDALDTVSS